MLRPALLLGCACWPAIAAAQPASLGEGEIRDLVSGATIALDAPLGSKIPIHYSPDGRVNGEARTLAFYLGAARDTGTWWIASGQLCHRWTRWFERKAQCLTLGRQGSTIHWRNQDGRTGTASVTVEPRITTAEAPPPALPWAHARMMPAGAMHLGTPRPLSPPRLPSVSAAEAKPPVAATPWKTTVKARRPPPASSLPRPPAAAAPPKAIAQAAPAPQPAPQQPPRQPELSKPQQPQPPKFIVANVERGDVLNVRAGPSADHDIVGTLVPGMSGITISGVCEAIWCPITLAATSGWVNRRFIEEHREGREQVTSGLALGAAPPARDRARSVTDSPAAPRSCLMPVARALLDRIEARFGPVRLVSTCRAGATIAGTGRPSRHASGNAFDFDAGSRKREVVEWLIANHRNGGTMTYPRMDHIHVDIGPHFVALAGGRRWANWRGPR
jgi:hypothetical protein